jgi:hypothetical protein
VGEDRSEAGAPGGDRRRLTVSQAAEALGVTVDAVRGRIRRGKLESEHDEGAVYVWVDTPKEADSQGPSPTSHGPSTDQALRLEDLREQVTYLREQLEAERQAHAEARRIIAGLVERIPAIEAPRENPPEPPESPAPTDTPTEAPEEAQEGVQRPWWRRVFGG